MGDIMCRKVLHSKLLYLQEMYKAFSEDCINQKNKNNLIDNCPIGDNITYKQMCLHNRPIFEVVSDFEQII